MTFSARSLVLVPVAAISLATTTAFAQESGLPDAQVESNVLKALANAQDLSTQNIQASTTYGVVTLSGTVETEALRVKAENLAARAEGVKKVIDELTLGTPGTGDAATQQPSASAGSQDMVLLSDGTYAPASQAGAPPQPETAAQSQQPTPQYAPQPQGYPQQAGAPQGYPQQPQPLQRRPMSPYGPPQGYYAEVPGGQPGGVGVTVPANSVLRIRINRGLDSKHAQAGMGFDGTVLTDVVANGLVAIPRGATVQGTVVDAEKAGVLSGHGELGLQLTTITIGGLSYPLQTKVWMRQGTDKTAGTVNRTVGIGALGAVLGAVAGGGKGAAIGAGVGAGVGLADSTDPNRGQVWIAPESVLTFNTAQPLAVTTVSEAEMQRLAIGAGYSGAGPSGPGPERRVVYRRVYSPYYGWYWAPVYYPVPPR